MFFLSVAEKEVESTTVVTEVTTAELCFTLPARDKCYSFWCKYCANSTSCWLLQLLLLLWIVLRRDHQVVSLLLVTASDEEDCCDLFK